MLPLTHTAGMLFDTEGDCDVVRVAEEDGEPLLLRDREELDEGDRDEDEQPRILPAGSVDITEGDSRESSIEQVAGTAQF